MAAKKAEQKPGRDGISVPLAGPSPVVLLKALQRGPGGAAPPGGEDAELSHCHPPMKTTGKRGQAG